MEHEGSFLEPETLILDRVPGVYKVWNVVNGKVYVGSSAVCTDKRITRHWRDLRRGNHGNVSKGKSLTEEHKAKISASNKGRVVSEETRNKIAETNKKTWQAYWAKVPLDSEIRKKHIREDKTCKESTKLKMAEAQRVRWALRKAAMNVD